MRSAPTRPSAIVTQSYISLFIGTPLIVFLFLLYYGLPSLGVTLSPFVIAVFGFTLNVSAYNARYLTIAYKGLDQAELESARAQGFSRFQVFRLITAPQSLRMSVPALTNQAIQNVKDSSIVFLIQYIEFFAQMQEVASRTFLFFKTYLFTAFVYLLLVSVVVLVARRLERRLAIPGMGRSRRLKPERTAVSVGMIFDRRGFVAAGSAALLSGCATIGHASRGLLHRPSAGERRLQQDHPHRGWASALSRFRLRRPRASNWATRRSSTITGMAARASP